jgi:hypothetical protein
VKRHVAIQATGSALAQQIAEYYLHLARDRHRWAI